MTLDGTNTWVLLAPGARRAVVVDPGPATGSPGRGARRRRGAGARVAGRAPHPRAPRPQRGRGAFAERAGVGVRALDPAHRLGDEGLGRR